MNTCRVGTAKLTTSALRLTALWKTKSMVWCWRCSISVNCSGRAPGKPTAVPKQKKNSSGFRTPGVLRRLADIPALALFGACAPTSARLALNHSVSPSFTSPLARYRPRTRARARWQQAPRPHARAQPFLRSALRYLRHLQPALRLDELQDRRMGPSGARALLRQEPQEGSPKRPLLSEQLLSAQLGSSPNNRISRDDL